MLLYSLFYGVSNGFFVERFVRFFSYVFFFVMSIFFFVKGYQMFIDFRTSMNPHESIDIICIFSLSGSGAT